MVVLPSVARPTFLYKNTFWLAQLGQLCQGETIGACASAVLGNQSTRAHGHSLKLICPLSTRDGLGSPFKRGPSCME